MIVCDAGRHSHRAGVHGRGESFDAPADPGVRLRHAVQAATVVGVQAHPGDALGEKPVQRISRSASCVDCAVIRPDSTMLVLTNVGHNTVTLIPVPASSAAKVSDSDSVPALLTL